MALGFLPARNLSWNMIFLVLQYLSEVALEQFKHSALECVLQDHLYYCLTALLREEEH